MTTVADMLALPSGSALLDDQPPGHVTVNASPEDIKEQSYRNGVRLPTELDQTSMPWRLAPARHTPRTDTPGLLAETFAVANLTAEPEMLPPDSTSSPKKAGASLLTNGEKFEYCLRSQNFKHLQLASAAKKTAPGRSVGTFVGCCFIMLR